ETYTLSLHDALPISCALGGRGEPVNRPWVDGNHVELLINGEQYYPRVFEAMAQAREEILLETFIIYDDKVGQQLQQVLIDAARRDRKSTRLNSSHVK